MSIMAVVDIFLASGSGIKISQKISQFFAEPLSGNPTRLFATKSTSSYGMIDARI